MVIEVWVAFAATFDRRGLWARRSHVNRAARGRSSECSSVRSAGFFVICDYGPFFPRVSPFFRVNSATGRDGYAGYRGSRNSGCS